MMRGAIFLMTLAMVAGREVDRDNALDTLLLTLSTVQPRHGTNARTHRVLPIKVKMDDEAASSDDAGAAAATPVATKTPISELKAGEEVEGTIVNVVDFGAFVNIGAESDALLHVRDVGEFVQNTNEYFTKGQKITATINKVDVDKKQIQLSTKGGEDSAKAAVASKYANFDPKEFITGKVKRITDFGAFVGLEGGIDGLLHISDLAEGRVERVEDVVDVGDEVNVRIISFESSSGGPKVALSMTPEGGASAGRGSAQSDDDVEYYDYNDLLVPPETQWVAGTVTSKKDFGAFVEVDALDGEQGLLHVSQIEGGDEGLAEIQEGDVVKVRVVSVDVDKGKISLSMKDPEGFSSDDEEPEEIETSGILDLGQRAAPSKYEYPCFGLTKKVTEFPDIGQSMQTETDESKKDDEEEKEGDGEDENENADETEGVPPPIADEIETIPAENVPSVLAEALASAGLLVDKEEELTW